MYNDTQDNFVVIGYVPSCSNETIKKKKKNNASEKGDFTVYLRFFMGLFLCVLNNWDRALGHAWQNYVNLY